MLVSTSVMIRIDESPPLIRNTIIKQNASRKVKTKELKYTVDNEERNERSDKSGNIMRNHKNKKKDKNTEWDNHKSGKYGISRMVL